MITFILLGVFAILGISFILIAWTAGNSKRAGQKGVSPDRRNHVTLHR